MLIIYFLVVIIVTVTILGLALALSSVLNIKIISFNYMSDIRQ
jgi:hypothetical protein